MSEKILFTTEEAAHALGMSLCHLRDLVARGVIPTVRLGRRRMINRDVLNDIANRGLATTPSQKRSINYAGCVGSTRKAARI